MGAATYRNRAQALNAAYKRAQTQLRQKLEAFSSARAEVTIRPLPNGRWEIGDVWQWGADPAAEPAAHVVMYRRRQP